MSLFLLRKQAPGFRKAVPDLALCRRYVTQNFLQTWWRPFLFFNKEKSAKVVIETQQLAWKIIPWMFEHFFRLERWFLLFTVQKWGSNLAHLAHKQKSKAYLTDLPYLDQNYLFCVQVISCFLFPAFLSRDPAIYRIWEPTCKRHGITSHVFHVCAAKV